MREVEDISRGIVPDRNRLYWDSFKQLVSIVPSTDEQKLIVRFLDFHSSAIAHGINAKRKLIAILNEQKQAIIHRAVTRGFDPNIRLKPCGIDWLGDVPEGWELKRLKWVTRLQRGYDLPADQRIQGPYPPAKPGRVTIAGKPSDDMAPGTLNSVLKQARLKGQK